MNYPEDFAAVTITFTTNDGSGGAIAPSSAFETADFIVVKNGSTIKSTANGLTVSSPFNSTVGLHLLVINTSVDTGDSGFWVGGAVYDVGLIPDETVDGQTVVKWVGKFTLTAEYDFTIDSADSDNVVLPSTYQSGAALPDDERYEWTALKVVAGTGIGQVVLLSTAGGTVPRYYLIVAGTMPITLDNTSKCKVLGTWMANSIGVPKRGETLRYTNVTNDKTADVVFDDVP